MIDTVLLKVPYPNFAVTRYEMFQPNAKGIFHEPYLHFNGQRVIRCINNPTQSDKLSGTYLPRLTIYKRVGKGGFGINLHIELSLPKLLYGNNFDELTDGDFEKVIQTLSSKLLFMGVHVKKDNLRTAPVYAIHYSKNISFDDFTSAHLILKDLGKIRINGRLDLNFTDFRNQGEAVRYYAKSHEFVCYDKIADLSKSKDRAMEKDGRDHNLQMNMFETLRRNGKPIEVVRLELRLKSRKKIEHQIGKVNIHSDLTFQSLYSEKTAKLLLQHYWSSIYEELLPVILQDLNAAEQFELIARQRRGFTPMRLLAITAICEMIRQEGHRTVRNRLKQKCSSRTLERLYKEIKGLDFRILNRAAPFEAITQALSDFIPLKKSDFSVYLPPTT